MAITLWPSLYSHQCMTITVWPSLYSIHCMTITVWPSLYGHQCMTITVWPSLYSYHCMTFIVSNVVASYRWKRYWNSLHNLQFSDLILLLVNSIHIKIIAWTHDNIKNLDFNWRAPPPPWFLQTQTWSHILSHVSNNL